MDETGFIPEAAEETLPNPVTQARMLEGAGSRKLAKASGRQPEGLAPTIGSKEEFDLLPEGAKWIDPEGKPQIKPYMPQSPQDWKRVPEGATWIAPDGSVQTKPKYEDISVSANTFYNMANENEKRQALEYSYPGKVKEDPAGDLYVEEDGKLMRPRGILSAPLSAGLGAAIPTTLGVAGEVAGSLLGPFGAVGGSFVGSAAGQGINDFILRTLGITDRSLGEELGSAATAGVVGGAGTWIGRTVGSIGTALAQLRKAKPSAIANSMLGVDPEGLEMAINLKRQGVETVPVSGFVKSAPRLVTMAETFDQAFNEWGPIRTSAEKHMEKKGTAILREMGDESEIGSLVKPTAAPPLRDAGQKALDKARANVAAADAKLAAAQQEQLAPLEAQIPGLKQAEEAKSAGVSQALGDLQKAGTQFIDATYTDIFKDINEAVKLSGAGRNSGELWATIGAKFQALKRAFNVEAGKFYSAWDDQFGARPMHASLQLSDEADAFLAKLPSDFKSQNPALIQKLAKVGGVRDPETGEMIKPPEILTLGELHELRNLFRYKTDWYKLASDPTNGAHKLFAGKIDRVLAVDKEAYKDLSKIDAWYNEHGKIYAEKRIQAVINGLEGGQPADPVVLYETLIRDGRTDLNKKLEKMLGPNLWAGVRAADLDDVFMAARTTVDGPPSTRTVDANAFIREIMKRRQSGMLESIHGEKTERKLLTQVQNLRLLDGDLPIDVRPGDQFIDIVTKIQAAQAALKDKAATNPLKLLTDEISAMRAAHTKEMRAQRGEARSGPLGFLLRPSMGAEEAAQKLLAKGDTILEAERAFGRDSPEFIALQLAAARRMLQGTLDPGAALLKYDEATQRALFPGISYDQMHMLAKEMAFMMGSKVSGGDTGKSIAAQSRVQNPMSQSPFPLPKWMHYVPGATMIAGSTLGAFYATVRNVMNKQWLLESLQKGVGSRDPAVREAAQKAMRNEIRQEMRKASAVAGGTGAGVAQATYQTPTLEE